MQTTVTKKSWLLLATTFFVVLVSVAAVSVVLPVNGGTGINSSSSTGVAQVASGAWAVSTTLPSGIAATNMSLTTPTLGAASATTINKVTVTAPATGSTLTIADGTTLSNTYTMNVAKTAGVAGAIPWFDTTTSTSASALLTQYGVMIGGGASAAPSTIAASTTTTNALFATATSPAFRAIASGDIPSAALPAQTTTVSSGSISVTTNNTYVYCTTTCSVTPLAVAAGVQLCVRNEPGVSSVITLVALGSGKYYELTTHAGWGTANHTVVSGGSTSDSICLVGYDGTHYAVFSFAGTWTD